MYRMCADWIDITIIIINTLATGHWPRQALARIEFGRGKQLRIICTHFFYYHYYNDTIECYWGSFNSSLTGSKWFCWKTKQPTKIWIGSHFSLCQRQHNALANHWFNKINMISLDRIEIEETKTMIMFVRGSYDKTKMLDQNLEKILKSIGNRIMMTWNYFIFKIIWSHWLLHLK